MRDAGVVPWHDAWGESAGPALFCCCTDYPLMPLRDAGDGVCCLLCGTQFEIAGRSVLIIQPANLRVSRPAHERGDGPDPRIGSVR